MRELETNDTEIALTLGHTRGVGVDTTPPRKVFLIFFSLEDKTLACDVFSSCSFNPSHFLRQIHHNLAWGQL